MKILVVSACTNGLCQNKVALHPNVTFICFDKTNFSERQKAMHPRLLGKVPKMLAWELMDGYDAYIWIDSPFSIKKAESIQWFINQLGDKKAAFFVHPYRNSVKDEYDYCVSLMRTGNQYLLDRYVGENMDEQINKYKADPSYEDNILLACGAFIYSKDLVENRNYNVLKEWFYHNCLYSVQDQLSLPYLLQKFNVDYNLINKNIYETMNSL